MMTSKKWWHHLWYWQWVITSCHHHRTILWCNYPYVYIHCSMPG